MEQLVDTVTQTIFDFLEQTPLVGVLLVLIFCDVLSGLAVAWATKTINSSTSVIGMTRKAFIVMFVSLGRILEPHAQGVPVTNLVAGFYCASELLSIIENAGKLGVPIPQAIRDAMSKLRPTSEVEIKVPEQTIRVRAPEEVLPKKDDE